METRQLTLLIILWENCCPDYSQHIWFWDPEAWIEGAGHAECAFLPCAMIITWHEHACLPITTECQVVCVIGKNPNGISWALLDIRKWKERLRHLLRNYNVKSTFIGAREDTQINSTVSLPIWAPSLDRKIRPLQYKGESDYVIWKVWMWVIRKRNQTHSFIVHSTNIYWVLLFIHVLHQYLFTVY